MRLIVGLGNPGEKYQNTRHNLGFWVVEALAKKWGLVWKSDKKTNSLKARKSGAGLEVILAKPLTSMNASGEAVQKLMQFYHLESLDNLVVVHDDLDLALGEIKVVKGRGAAGHRGVESVINSLGNRDFTRLRLGIGRPGFAKAVAGKPKKEVVDFVLGEFRQKGKVEAKKMIKKAVKMILRIFKDNLEE